MEIVSTIDNIKTKNIELNYNNQNFTINLSYSTKLKISIINSIEKRITYSKEYSLEQIKDINKYFLMCETINDVIGELTNNINDNTVISYQDNNLILKILLPCNKNKEAKFILNKEKKSLEDEIIFLNEIIKEQNIKIENQEKDILSLKEKMSKLEEKIELLGKINDINFDYIKNINEFYEYEETKTLKKIIGRKCNLKLLYQMRKDGNSCSVFHDKVDNQGPTITLFKTEDGYKFGGYTSKSFSCGLRWITDVDAFLFNFLNLNKFPIKNKNGEAIFLGHKNKFGPEFRDIFINQSDISKGYIEVSNFINKIEDLKAGNSDFISTDVIVYKVEFL
jgi:hypothetical protein